VDESEEEGYKEPEVVSKILAKREFLGQTQFLVEWSVKWRQQRNVVSWVDASTVVAEELVAEFNRRWPKVATTSFKSDKRRCASQGLDEPACHHLGCHYSSIIKAINERR
jgi:hypothetical protein